MTNITVIDNSSITISFIIIIIIIIIIARGSPVVWSPTLSLKLLAKVRKLQVQNCHTDRTEHNKHPFNFQVFFERVSRNRRSQRT